MKNLTGKASVMGLTCLALLSSCANNTETGALTGSAIGAGAGALISHNIGGAIIGGVIGAGAGALIGYQLDERDRQALAEQSPSTLERIDKREQLSAKDIIQMRNAGISDDVIVSEFKATRSYLTGAEAVKLKEAGFSDTLIQRLVDTSNSY